MSILNTSDLRPKKKEKKETKNSTLLPTIPSLKRLKEACKKADEEFDEREKMLEKEEKGTRRK